MSQQQANQYQRNQDEADRIAMLEKSKNHPLINGLLQYLFGSRKS